ncbi:MAG: cupin domain-containing protein [Actinomycetota bacterium]|nr:cupin domain-containing protein [Actinomycetota bacterium]
MPEAKLNRTEEGLVSEGEGWYVVNAREARWEYSEAFGSWTTFEGDDRWQQMGVNIGVLEPGKPACMYHGEASQEGFLVLEGECLLLVEGEERRLGRWDFFHCAPWTEHVLIGAGDRPCVVVAMGARNIPDHGLLYPVNETALKHGAGVEQETTQGKEAYAPFPQAEPGSYRHGDLLPPG